MAMSGPPNNADSDRVGFTCSALLMCLYLPGRSGKKKPEEESSTSRPHVETKPALDHPTEAEQVPSRAASLEKFECASLYSGNNIVFDFVVEEGEEEAEQAAAGSPAVQGYCPSPCFDLPVELIRAGERYGAVAAAASDAPVTAAFVFGDYQGAALKKMASSVEALPPHLVRFLSASGSSVRQPPMTPSRARAAPPRGAAVDGDCGFADGASAQRQPAGFPEQETVV